MRVAESGSSTNQSATATLWPLTVVCTRLGDTPRSDTRSPSPNSRLMTTPGTRCAASARFLSGSWFLLPLHRFAQRFGDAEDRDLFGHRLLRGVSGRRGRRILLRVGCVTAG